MTQRTCCTISDCDRPHAAKGLCDAHYRRLRRGLPIEVPIRSGRKIDRNATQEERFWDKVVQNGRAPDYAPHLSPCWEWDAALNEKGYGLIRFDGATRIAHRVSLELAGIELIDGLVVDHLCRVRHCVNPGHLEQVLPAENTHRSPIAVAAIHGRKTHCHRGHEFDLENTYYFKCKGGTGRQCRKCAAISRSKSARRKRAA